MRVIIIGAGVGGLTLALSLARSGARCTVVEQSPALGEAGAGLQLSPNACKALFSLGLEDPLRADGFAPEAAEVRDRTTGRRLLRTPLGAAAEARWGAPYLQIHRADLQRALLGALETAGGTQIMLGTRATPDGEGVRLEDGRRLAADLVVACDGARSEARRQVAGSASARFTGEVAWRGTVAAEALPAGSIPPLAQVWTGSGRHFVHYPVRGGALVNFVAVTHERTWRVESWSEPGRKEALKAAFEGWPEPVGALIAAVPEVLRWALYARKPLRRWSRGPLTLLGDAAHPMLPFLAQGAAMAVEDAVALTRCLEPGDPLAGLARYERARLPRTAKVQAWSRRNAWLFHLPPAAAAGVFGAARLLDRGEPEPAQQRFDWLYGYDAGAAPL